MRILISLDRNNIKIGETEEVLIEELYYRTKEWKDIILEAMSLLIPESNKPEVAKWIEKMQELMIREGDEEKYNRKLEDNYAKKT